MRRCLGPRKKGAKFYSVPTLFDRIPDEIKPMAAIGVGAFILVLLVLLHGAGLHGVLVLHKRGVRRLKAEPPHFVRALFLFGLAVFLMLALHLLGFTLWALSLLRLGLIPRAYNAFYFCANAYTTLGFGSVDLDAHWRNIAPIIAISGMFSFAWTTSALVSVVTAHGELIAQLEDRREREMEMRFAFRKDAWAALEIERQAERSEEEKARAQAAGASLFLRLVIRRNEMRRVRELRKAKAAEILELRRKERELEANIAPAVLPRDSSDGK